MHPVYSLDRVSSNSLTHSSDICYLNCSATPVNCKSQVALPRPSPLQENKQKLILKSILYLLEQKKSIDNVKKRCSFEKRVKKNPKTC